QTPGQLRRDLGQGQHAVRVTDGGGAVAVLLPADDDALVDDLALDAAHGDLRGVEAHPAEVGVDAPAARMDAAANWPPLGDHDERRRRHQAAIEEAAREDAHAVAALLGLSAVGVEDAQAEATLGGQRARQQAVRADAVVAIADPPDLARLELAADG